MNSNAQRRVCLSLLFVAFLFATRAFGCSCVTTYPGSFVDPAPQGLAANSSGVVWLGEIPDPGNNGSTALGFFGVHEIRADGSEVDLPADVKLLIGPPTVGQMPMAEWIAEEPILISPDFEGTWVPFAGEEVRPRQSGSESGGLLAGVWIVSPAAGLTPGATYRFSYGENQPDLRSAAIEKRSVTVTVDESEVGPVADLTLLRDEPRTDWVTVSADASCSRKLLAARVGLALDLPDRLLRLSKSIFFTTLVNGEVWEPSNSLCSSPDPGASWRGRGRDELYLSCGQWKTGLAEAKYLGTDLGLAEGTYQVEMIAWLPGRFEVGRGRAVVELSCGAES